ncbi:MAG: ABC transporter permease [Alphaproteobacteria bacterium]
MRIGSKKLPISGLGAYTVVYLTFIYLPVLFLPLFSFNDGIYVAFPLKGFTLEWYETMSESQGLLLAFENSVKVGIAVSIISTVFGTLAAKAFTRYTLPFNSIIKGFIAVPLVIPLIILGISLMVVLNQAGIDLSLFTIALGHVVICVPFSMLVMMSRLEGFDKGLEEAAQDLGETPWMTFWRVTFPLAMPGIVASLLLCFTISFDEFLLAFFLAGDQATLPVYIWSQLRFPNKLPSVLALGSCILVASAVIVVLAELVRRLGVQAPKEGQ